MRKTASMCHEKLCTHRDICCCPRRASVNGFHQQAVLEDAAHELPRSRVPRAGNGGWLQVVRSHIMASSSLDSRAKCWRERERGRVGPLEKSEGASEAQMPARFRRGVPSCSNCNGQEVAGTGAPSLPGCLPPAARPWSK